MPFISSVRGSYGPQGRFGRALGLILSTGGTITTVGGYRIHTFTTIGTSTFTAGGAGSLEYLIIGGGGGGSTGDSGNDGGGGGGAGGYLSGSATVSAQSYSINVGSGAPAINNQIRVIGTLGTDSTAFGLTAVRGGSGGQCNSNGTSGGSGGGSGGGGGTAPGYVGGSPTPGQGFRGGNNTGVAPHPGAGGGGAGGAGGDTGSGLPGGTGGSGVQNSISGTTTGYAAGGGGGGGIPPVVQAGPGGNFGGGNGGAVNDTGTAGYGQAATTYGSGGGGGSNKGYYTYGGYQGIVIIRYPI